jgi:hypothetical protein
MGVPLALTGQLFPGRNFDRSVTPGALPHQTEPRPSEGGRGLRRRTRGLGSDRYEVEMAGDAPEDQLRALIYKVDEIIYQVDEIA